MNIDLIDIDMLEVNWKKPLSEFEKQVAMCFATGLTLTDTAEFLEKSVSNINETRRRIKKKLDRV